MDKELKKYYEERFSTMSTKGWDDFVEDAQQMYDTCNKVTSVDTHETLLKRKGQLDILSWILTIKAVSENAFEELELEEAV